MVSIWAIGISTRSDGITSHLFKLRVTITSSPWFSMLLQRLLSCFRAGAQAEWAVWQWSIPSAPKRVYLCWASTAPWSKTLTFSPMSTSLAVPWFKVRYLWMPTSSAWSTCLRDPARLESQLQMLPVQAASYLHQRVFLMTNSQRFTSLLMCRKRGELIGGVCVF